ncbi:hypothetical protein ACPV5U_19625 [Vibrio mediterranei]
MAITANWIKDIDTDSFVVGMGFMDLPYQQYDQFKNRFSKQVASEFGREIEIDFCLPTTSLTANVVTQEEASQLAVVFDEVKVLMKQPYKSANAKKVLQLMDSCQDGQDRYQEFVRLVAKDANISIEVLEAELEPFI